MNGQLSFNASLKIYKFLLNNIKNHLFFMEQALIQAKIAKENNEVPVGAVVVQDNVIVGKGFNQNIYFNSVSAHAEIIAINDASNYLKNYRLINCEIYVTLEPCHMCAKAIVDARLKHLYFSTPDPKTGAIISIDSFLSKSFLNHKVKYEYGILKEDSSLLLQKFFQAKRQKNRV